jgi:putative Mg2+ transporter-C (MgtC) family protein
MGGAIGWEQSDQLEFPTALAECRRIDAIARRDMPIADMQLATALARLGVALALGAAIGIERQWNQKTAGLRTNALVALGASGFVIFSTMVGAGDPTRVAAQVVSGIGFLGAGIILREGANVHGLNTAATLWCSAMVGTFAGGGYWRPSIAAAGFVVMTNLLLRPLIWRLNRRSPIFGDGETRYSIEITCRGAEEAHVRSQLLQALSQAELGLRRLDSEDIPDTSKVAVTAQAVAGKRNDALLEQIVGRLSLEPHVTAATWQVARTEAEA